MRIKSCGAGIILALALFAACSEKPAAGLADAPAGPAPDSFRVAFETTRGTFIVQAHRAWAPNGVDRFYTLVNTGFYDDNGFFRVVPDFIVQFGGGSDPKAIAHWDSLRIADDKRVEKNTRGTISLAQTGSGARNYQVFINLSDNEHLDVLGFSPIGRVVEGMGIVDLVYPGYREKPDYHLIATAGNSYLRRMFPKLDYVQKARILP